MINTTIIIMKMRH